MSQTCTPGSPEKTVLIVEDNREAAKLLSMHVAEAGYHGLIAYRGEDALLLAARTQPTAIILDILLPTIDGWEVLAKLKASPATRDLPVIILSVLDRQTLGFQLGALEHLVKPVERLELLRALAKCERARSRRAPEGYRIVVVDDDSSRLDALAHTLYCHGYDVIPALGRAEGVHLTRAAHPDLVVLDLLISRPYDEVLADLRADRRSPVFPILILETTALPTEQSLFLRGTVQSVIVQAPGNEDSLITAIRGIFEQMQTPSPEANR